MPAHVFSMAMFNRSKQLIILNTAYHIAVAGLAVAVLYVSWNLWSTYANWPTYMKTEIVEQMRADFPAVTVCKLDPCERPDGQARNCTGQLSIVLCSFSCPNKKSDSSFLFQLIT